LASLGELKAGALIKGLTPEGSAKVVSVASFVTLFWFGAGLFNSVTQFSTNSNFLRNLFSSFFVQLGH